MVKEEEDKAKLPVSFKEVDEKGTTKIVYLTDPKKIAKKEAQIKAQAESKKLELSVEDRLKALEAKEAEIANTLEEAKTLAEKNAENDAKLQEIAKREKAVAEAEAKLVSQKK